MLATVDAMTGPDVSRLSPADASTALRSLARRIASLCAAGIDDDVEELAARLGPEGESAHDLLVDATSTLMLLGRALAQVLVHDDSVLHPAVTDPSHRRWDPPTHLSVADLVELLSDEATTVADQIDAVPTFDWDRTGRVADREDVSAIDIAREAVRTMSVDRTAVERALSSARAQ